MRERRLFLVSIGIALLAVLILSQVTLTPLAAAKGGPPAKIVWSQNFVRGVVTPTESITTSMTTVVFTPTADVKSANLRLTPSLKGTVTLSSTTFSPVLMAGVPVTVDVTFTAPASGGRHTFNGNLFIRDGHRTLAKPLHLRFKVVNP